MESSVSMTVVLLPPGFNESQAIIGNTAISNDNKNKITVDFFVFFIFHLDCHMCGLWFVAFVRLALTRLAPRKDGTRQISPVQIGIR